VGCGRIAPKGELMRFAVDRRAGGSAAPVPGRALAVHDGEYRMQGRGAYLCPGERGELPAPDCLAQAIRRGGIARALRAAVTLDPKIVESVSR
jgi:predicted RNA-binding protein YlxR (DUF448 family)